MMPSRIGCCVPHCGRTRVNESEYDEWICGDHWRLVCGAMRRVHTRLSRRMKRGLEPAGGRQARVWRRVKRAAMEAAGGIG